MVAYLNHVFIPSCQVVSCMAATATKFYVEKQIRLTTSEVYHSVMGGGGFIDHRWQFFLLLITFHRYQLQKTVDQVELHV